MPAPIVAAVVSFISLCIVVDVRTRRIPNVVSGTAMLAGVMLNTVYSGGAGLFDSLAGLLTAIAVLLVPFAFGGVGGGDVKMMGALGALLGPTLALAGLGVGVIYGGVVMIVHLIRCGRLREKLAAMRAMLTAAALTGSLQPLHVRPDDAGAVALPYSVPLGLGTITVLALASTLGVS
jgi:prepilin peptidase CpaA